VAPHIWGEISIRFLSDERVQVFIPAATQTRNYAEMGFEDRRTGRPNKAWETLRQLAQEGGLLKVDRSPQGYPRQSKRVEEIRRVLRKHFGIPQNPLPLDKTSGHYRPQFDVHCAPSFET
jgi:hypothetical protein